VEEIIEKEENRVVEGMDDRLASAGLWLSFDILRSQQL